jgi:hypothetical protein
MEKEIEKRIGRKWRKDPIVLLLIEHDIDAVLDGLTKFERIGKLSMKEKMNIYRLLVDSSLTRIWSANYIPWEMKKQSIQGLLQKRIYTCFWKNLGKHPEIDEYKKMMMITLYESLYNLEILYEKLKFLPTMYFHKKIEEIIQSIEHLNGKLRD